MKTRGVKMYKIVNNNIYIARGETATYTVKVVDRATGAPFILPPEIRKAIVSFGVRRSDYIKDGFAIKKQLWLCGIDESLEDTPEIIDCTDQIKLDTEIIYTYDPNDEAWADDYDFINTQTSEVQPNDIKALFRRLLPDGTYEYMANLPEKQDDESYKPHWVPYDFTIRFPFLYGDTAQLSPKSYKYSMTIYGGNDLQLVDGEIDSATIDYKKPLIDAQFIVEADINE